MNKYQIIGKIGGLIGLCMMLSVAIFYMLFWLVSLIPSTTVISTDILISFGSAVLSVSSLPGLINRKAQFPRWGSVITAAVLTYFIPLFYISGLAFTSYTLVCQAAIWWGIFALRPIKNLAKEAKIKELEGLAEKLKQEHVEYAKCRWCSSLTPEDKMINGLCPACYHT